MIINGAGMIMAVAMGVTRDTIASLLNPSSVAPSSMTDSVEKDRTAQGYSCASILNARSGRYALHRVNGEWILVANKLVNNPRSSTQPPPTRA